MKINEIITEEAMGVINDTDKPVLGHVHTLPNQNMNHGSARLHWRFAARAVPAAGAGDTPDGDMGEENWHGGDPVYKPYHPVEEEMIDRALKHIGDSGGKRTMGNHRSEEPKDTHKQSPMQPRGPVQLKSKK
jgi:hypothetical protein